MQTGSLSFKVSRVLIALDLTREVLRQAKNMNAELVITHHPLIFNAVKSIETASLLHEVVSCGLNVISAHTNLDKALSGVSFNLAKVLELQEISILDGSEGFGRLGVLKKSLNLEQFLCHVSKSLNSVVKTNRVEGLFEKVAVISGSGGSFWKIAKESGADVLVTGECRHNNFVDALNENFCLVEAGHFETENLICAPLKEQLAFKFKDIDFVVAKNCKSTYGFFGDLKWL